MQWSGNPGSLHTANEDPTTIGVPQCARTDLPFFVVIVREFPVSCRRSADRLTETRTASPAGGFDGVDSAKYLTGRGRCGVGSDRVAVCGV
jgi:hypothetical protein